jgi:hypothetical protein
MKFLAVLAFAVSAMALALPDVSMESFDGCADGTVEACCDILGAGDVAASYCHKPSKSLLLRLTCCVLQEKKERNITADETAFRPSQWRRICLPRYHDHEVLPRER